MLINHLTLLQLRLENERPLDCIALTLFQSGNNLDHAACRPAGLNLASPELSVTLRHEDHFFAIQILEGIFRDRYHRRCIVRQCQFDCGEHLRLQLPTGIGNLDPCLDRAGRFVHQVGEIGDAAFQFQVGESADNNDRCLPSAHLCQILLVDIHQHPDVGKIGDGVETFGGVGEFTDDGVLLGNDAADGGTNRQERPFAAFAGKVGGGNPVQGQALFITMQFGLGGFVVGLSLEDVLAGGNLLLHQDFDPVHVGKGEGKFRF